MDAVALSTLGRRYHTSKHATALFAAKKQQQPHHSGHHVLTGAGALGGHAHAEAAASVPLTLGYRGEALASIAELAQLTVTTRTTTTARTAGTRASSNPRVPCPYAAPLLRRVVVPALPLPVAAAPWHDSAEAVAAAVKRGGPSCTCAPAGTAAGADACSLQSAMAESAAAEAAETVARGTASGVTIMLTGVSSTEGVAAAAATSGDSATDGTDWVWRSCVEGVPLRAESNVNAPRTARHKSSCMTTDKSVDSDVSLPALPTATSITSITPINDINDRGITNNDNNTSRQESRAYQSPTHAATSAAPVQSPPQSLVRSPPPGSARARALLVSPQTPVPASSRWHSPILSTRAKASADVRAAMAALSPPVQQHQQQQPQVQREKQEQ